MKVVSKIVSIITAPFVFAVTLLTGCLFGNKPNTPPGEPNGEKSKIMRDANVAPTVQPTYQTACEQAFSAYKSVADAHLNEDGDIDWENEEVNSAARAAAAQMFAYARYNLYYLDKYVYFSDQDGSTDLGSMGAARAMRQEYYIRVNENENSCGLRYHSTVKKVVESSGMVGSMGSLFESGRLRITDKTDLLYRFECSDLKAVTSSDNETLATKVLNCPWTKGKDWGKHDVKMVKRTPVAAADIKGDIQQNAGKTVGDVEVTMPGNINILADNVVQCARIMEADDGYVLIMNINTDVANADEASTRMLRNANDSDDCVWKRGESCPEDTPLEEDTGLKIVCRLWKNGLLRQITINERWAGKISMFSGTADSVIYTYYSYSDADCDMTEHLKTIQ